VDASGPREISLSAPILPRQAARFRSWPEPPFHFNSSAYSRPGFGPRRAPSWRKSIESANTAWRFSPWKPSNMTPRADGFGFGSDQRAVRFLGATGTRRKASPNAINHLCLTDLWPGLSSMPRGHATSLGFR